VRISVVDPAAFTPPYDRALCAALAAEGLDVELATMAFRHGEVPAAGPGYAVAERFRSRRHHVADMLALRRRRGADLVHFQWLPLQEVDRYLLPRRPRVLTAHDVLPRQPRRFQRAAQLGLYARMDAVVAHTEHSRARLEALGVPPERVHVIGHGAFTHLAGVTPVAPPELSEPDAERPVVLFFGLLRPYKGLDVLLDAWRRVPDGAELWVVGAPRMPVPALPAGARLVPRFVTEAETAWCFDRAQVVALPYREIEGSGVLFTALGAGKATVVSDVGGFSELGDAVARVPPGDPAALAATLERLLADPVERAAQAARAAAAAAGRHGWAASARAHRALYEGLATG
jgi:glycosyltransferase involved in cell wall biosynthesis